MKSVVPALYKKQNIAKSAWIAPSVYVAGHVTIGDQSNIWPGCILRADLNSITIGKRTNLQDGTLVHVESDQSVKVGNDVTVGHGVIIHACTIEDGALIGMGAILLNGCQIGKGAQVAAGALVPEGMKVPARTLVMGVPARVVRKLKAQEIKRNVKSAGKYVEMAACHRQLTAYA